MKRALVLGAIVFAALSTYAVWRVFLRPRDRGFGPVEHIQKIAENVYLIPGAGGNTAAFVTSAGVVLVDTKVANRGQGIVTQLSTVTDKPVTHIINTHSHGDHTGSNLFFPGGVEIVSHVNTEKNMKRMSNFLFGWKKDALPDRTYRDKLTLFSGQDSIDLYYFGPAHTDGDTFVIFREAHVMHAGDVFAEKGVPRIDAPNGGSGVAYAETMSRAVDGIHDVDTVISGHGGLMTWPDFVEYAEFTKSMVDFARRAHDAGDTVDEAVAGFTPAANTFKNYDMTEAAGMFTTVYAELPDNRPVWARAYSLVSSLVTIR
jgi:glyoxylase-like metal-dependent hydrolase (beta-lactamase superfamily II)